MIKVNGKLIECDHLFRGLFCETNNLLYHMVDHEGKAVKFIKSCGEDNIND